MFPCKELFGVLDLDIVLGKQKSLRARGKFAGREPVRRMGRGFVGSSQQSIFKFAMTAGLKK